ncbi:hypothetical protein [Sphingomonas endolithica]|uniref:hypothetical protein n=1 Tax=Sphingomonas endolithica TaxID=2972485 RepID=UPI0021AF29A2|nr:hypothetical protein [Sphingomonas sp. ZFBP2030]
MPRPLKTLLLTALIALPNPASAQSAAPPVAAAPAVFYADYADLVLAAPVIVDATIRSLTRIKGADALDVAPGHARLYVEADVAALIRGTQPLPPRIGYVLDVTADAHGRLPNLKKARVLLFARPVAGSAAQIQLIRPDAQRGWTPSADELTRRIATETLAAAPPPEITGVGNAFHVAGSLPGEGETQVFLATKDARPVSLSIVRRPGQERRWSVSLSDVVDQTSGPPERDTLLWYRLACSLPGAFPGDTSTGEGTIAAEDYRFVIESLGTCDRGR